MDERNTQLAIFAYSNSQGTWDERRMAWRKQRLRDHPDERFASDAGQSLGTPRTRSTGFSIRRSETRSRTGPLLAQAPYAAFTDASQKVPVAQRRAAGRPYS